MYQLVNRQELESGIIMFDLQITYLMRDEEFILGQFFITKKELYFEQKSSVKLNFDMIEAIFESIKYLKEHEVVN